MRLLTILLLLVVPAHAGIAKRVLRVDANAPNLIAPDRWRAYDKGFERDGDAFVCDNGAAPAVRGAAQTIVLNQKTPQPIVASAWSKCEAVSGGRDSDYSLYLDLIYADGDHLWGQVAMFDTGTHDWQQRLVRIFPEKAVKSIAVYVLLRRHSGKAWFRDVRLTQADVPEGAGMFDGLPVTPGKLEGGFSVRDIAAESDFHSFENGEALGLKLESSASASATRPSVRGTITDTTGRDRAITLVYTVPVGPGPWHWHNDARRSEPAVSPREYRAPGGRVSSSPLAVVTSDKSGRAVVLDLRYPAVFRVGFSAASNELYIAYDLALTKEKPSASVHFATIEFEPQWGYRQAIAHIYDVFPAAFRIPNTMPRRQGLWMPFAKISEVEGWEDFGFAYKEGNNETAWDDAHDILTFRYTEPMTWWMKMPKDMPRTMDAAIAEAKRLAEKGDKNAQALLTSGHHDEHGRFVARLLDTPWCDGAVWSMNSAPNIAGEVTDFKNKWNSALFQKLYGEAAKAKLDGEYIDSIEGYVTDPYDYRREHFSAMKTPLTFGPDNLKPAIHRGLIAFEYTRGIADDMHRDNKLMMANGTPGSICWLAPLLDVMGTETDWNPSGKWRPMSDRELLHRRWLCGSKPYCFLMNTNFDQFSNELVEKYMKRSLAYGMFPGFFSANASTGHYFTRKDLYNRDRPLFKKYVPLCRMVAETGWQPVTLARSSDEKVHVERWGRKYLTIFNDSPDHRTATLTLDGLAPGGMRDLVSGAELKWAGNRLSITLAGEDVAVVEVK